MLTTLYRSAATWTALGLASGVFLALGRAVLVRAADDALSLPSASSTASDDSTVATPVQR
jgi:hypothetical protein